MNRITLILGGARSGKSAFALKLAKKYRKVAFIATGQGKDREMQERIKRHKESRPKNWVTFEEPGDLTKLLKVTRGFDCILIDCLTLLVSNFILSGDSGKQIFHKIEEMLEVLNKKKARSILVSNEVGLGLVPANKLGRSFRDIAGKANQLAAEKSGEVFFMVSGLPLKVKGGR